MIALEYTKQKSFFDMIFDICISTKNYHLVCLPEINYDNFEINCPLVLFYKKREQMLILRKDSKDSIISYEKTGIMKVILLIINILIIFIFSI